MNVLSARLNFAFLCDYASVSRDGKLSMNGIFENINSRTFPMQHPVLYVVANVSGVHNGDRFTCSVFFNEAPGQPVARILSEVQVDVNQRFGFIGQFVNVTFERPGSYTARFYLDNKELGGHEFQVRQI